MGFHVCEYQHIGEQLYPVTSSGDVTLQFDSGRSWEMPDMILHYVADHNWRPPDLFIEDVMSHQLIGGRRLQTKAVQQIARIGYLTGPIKTGSVPEFFVEKLESLMNRASRDGNRIQTRGG